MTAQGGIRSLAFAGLFVLLWSTGFARLVERFVLAYIGGVPLGRRKRSFRNESEQLASRHDRGRLRCRVCLDSNDKFGCAGAGR